MIVIKNKIIPLGDKIWVIKKNVHIEEVVKKEIDVNEFWYSKD